MIKKIYLLVFLLAFGFTGIYAQEEGQETTEEAMEQSNFSVSDEMTVDPEQNKNWREGNDAYPAKPKNAWELGVHVGHFFIDGDVDREIPGGFGVGLHLRKAVHYAFSIRADLFYGQTKFLETQVWRHRSFGGGLVESVFSPYSDEAGGWVPSVKTTYGYVAIQGVLNIGNLLFHKKSNKWNWYTSIGVGLDTHEAKLDLLDENGNAYSNVSDQISQFDLDTRDGRKEIKNAIEGIYDGEYETEGFKKRGIFRLGDETNVHVVLTASVGVSRKLSKRINIGLEHQVMASDNDYLDGIKFRTSGDQTNNADIGHYTNLRLGINLGNFDKVTEPLYWVNPLDQPLNDIAELKRRPELDLTDEDGDGVVDMLDQELDSPAGCLVDTRGVVLDSDGDGLADCKDAEPFSPPGYEIDEKGISQIPPVETLSETDVINIMNANCPGCKNRSGCGDWFLPMIHFDLDKYSIKPEFYGQMHHVATVMKMCPETCVTVYGHTDSRNTNEYNNVLSYNRAKAAVDFLVTNYGIDRNRLNLMYGGEETPLVSGSGSSKHYMNRRVEFRVCNAGDMNMDRPEGADAGSGVSGSGVGNKNAGY